MAIRLAILLAVVIGVTFAYWQYQVRTALEAAKVDAVSADQCEDLEETDALAKDGDASAQDVDEAALQARLDACAAAGFGEEDE